MGGHRGARRVERGAIWAFAPVVAMLPFSLLALFVIWLPIGWLTSLSFWWFLVAFLASGLGLFIRPIQVLVLTPVLGARRPTSAEADVIAPLWAQIAQANDLPPSRFVVRVLPSQELNAYACGGHLVVVTTYAVEELSREQLRGVLAHELSHHLGLMGIDPAQPPDAPRTPTVSIWRRAGSAVVPSPIPRCRGTC